MLGIECNVSTKAQDIFQKGQDRMKTDFDIKSILNKLHWSYQTV